MVSPEFFYNRLTETGIEYFAGVPDSLLKAFCAYITDHAGQSNHVIAANEGAAIGQAMGYYLATNKPPLVYMQNSGLGNTVNPLMSLVDKEVYSIPMILMIGWRGEPGVKDEPQHVKQGRVMLQTLDAMEIPYGIIDGDETHVAEVISEAVKTAKEKACAYAIVVKKGTFDNYTLQNKIVTDFPFNREDVIKSIVNQLNPSDIVVATTGMASRELFEYRTACGQSHERDFLTVGGMGHASQIALGIAAQKHDRRIICIDGDGAALMHMGSMAINGMSGLSNFKHIIINNGAHDSVGGQPTIGFKIDLLKIADGCGYQHRNSVDSELALEQAIPKLLQAAGPAMLEIHVNKGSRKDLGRPTVTPQQNKKAFMNFVRS